MSRRAETLILLAGVCVSAACGSPSVETPDDAAAETGVLPVSLEVGGAAASQGRSIVADASRVDGSLSLCESAPSCGGCSTIDCDATGTPSCELPPERCEVFSPRPMPLPDGVGIFGWGSGVALGDIDGDGWTDAVYGGPAGVTVMRNVAGALEPWSDAIIGRSPQHVIALTLVDVDGDRDLDLFTTSQRPTPGMQFMENVAGRLIPVSVALPPSPAKLGGPAWGDFDGDEDLDVFVPAYFEEASLLLRNDGGWRFTDVAPLLGVDEPLAASLQGTWLDFDDDSDLDLLVSNDKGPFTDIPNRLFENDGAGAFREVGSGLGIIELVDGMGIAIGDVDGDLDLDIYITDAGLRDSGQLFYVNEGDALVESSVPWGINATRFFAWGTNLFDLENDGDLDLAIASTDPGWVWLGENTGERFVELDEVVSGLPRVKAVGSAQADFDQDGRVDLGYWLQNNDETAHFAYNIHPDAGHFLSVALENRAPNTHGIGSTVYVETRGMTQMRVLQLGSSCFSSDEPILHFGLGDATTVDVIEIRWPDGERQRIEGPIEVDQRLTVRR